MIIASRILQQKRQAVCDTCPHKKQRNVGLKLVYCAACGCALKPKIACAPCTCPKGKWQGLSGKVNP